MFVLVAWIVCLAACAPQSRHKVLTFFFDGVPEPGAAPAAAAGGPPEVSRSASPALPNGRAEGAVFPPGSTGMLSAETGLGEASALIVPAVQLPILQAKLWQQALAILPKLRDGSVNWVEAVREETILPLASFDKRARPSTPLTLDTVVPFLAHSGTPPLDLDIARIPDRPPADGDLYRVVFPHSSHSLWLNCSSCHPGLVKMDVGMSSILAGQSCGKCHGKVAFDPETACYRCHVNLEPVDEQDILMDLVRSAAVHAADDEDAIARGATLYRKACAVCHGETGDGNGPLAEHVDPRPRDFTKGRFKFRSTPTVSIPTDPDIYRSITRGFPGTSMPGWSFLPSESRWDLVSYIKSLSPKFAKQQPTDVFPIPEAPEPTDALLAMGADLYIQAGCHSCHGDEGRGDGLSAPTLKDEWGYPLMPYDFTGGIPPKGGATPADVYRTMMTGLQGTPMPDYGEVFEPEMAWSVVYHVLSLGEESREAGYGLPGDVRFAREMREGDIPPARFPHWFHRVRFRCSACHPSAFEMKAGAADMTMDEMRLGKFCANCHNGEIAWQIAFPTCVRCHTQTS